MNYIIAIELHGSLKYIGRETNFQTNDVLKWWVKCFVDDGGPEKDLAKGVFRTLSTSMMELFVKIDNG